MKDMIARYNPASQAIHWVMALIIFGMLATGLLADALPMELKKLAMFNHKSFGVLVLGLVVIRLFWRFTYPAPMLPAGTPVWQKAVAHSTHALLYGLMIAMPLSGWMMADAAGRSPTLFGLKVPMLLEQGHAFGKLAYEFHETAGFILLGLVVLHVGAAVYHRIKKDGILERMLPARCEKGESCCCKH